MEISESMKHNITFNDFIIPLKDNQIFIPDVGPAILLDTVNENLFSNKQIDFSRIELLRNGFTLRYNDQVYFVISELSRYIDFLTTSNFKIDKISNICPINFHILNNKLVDNDNIYRRIYDKLFGLRKYIIDNYPELISYYWPSFFKGIVSNFVPNPMMMIITFKRATGKPLILNIIDINDEILIISQDKVNDILEKTDEDRLKIDNDKYFSYVVDNWSEIIKMDDEKEYIINNLALVTGSTDMAKFIFESKVNKEKFIIKISDLNNIINFSSVRSKKEYIDYFCDNYSNLFESKNDDIFINFEGFNKYLLNLNPLHLKSFDDKEQINEMYYNITNALVECYEKLYNYMKI